MKNTAGVYIEPRATIPVLVVGDAFKAYGWRQDRPTGLFALPGRGGRPTAKALRPIGGIGAGVGDLRGRWSADAKSAEGGGVAVVIRRSLGRVRLTINGKAPAVDGPWSWSWIVERPGAQPAAGQTPRPGVDWPDVARAALRAALDLESSKCGAEGLTRKGASTREAAQIGRDVQAAGQTSDRPRGVIAQEAAAVAVPARPDKVRGAPKGGAQRGLFGAA